MNANHRYSLGLKCLMRISRSQILSLRQINRSNQQAKQKAIKSNWKLDFKQK